METQLFRFPKHISSLSPLLAAVLVNLCTTARTTSAAESSLKLLLRITSYLALRLGSRKFLFTRADSL